MIQIPSLRHCISVATLALCAGWWGVSPAVVNAQSYQPSDLYRDSSQVMPLSEATALLESAVRDLYRLIEPGQNPSPNELIAYADLRALRLYTGALEVAGWDFENAANHFTRADYDQYRYNSNISDLAKREARDQYLAFRETVRTLLYRVRMTAVSAEHQISFCDVQAVRNWQDIVYPALMDTIRATQPLFYEEDDFRRYHAPGSSANNNVVPTSSGIDGNAKEIRNAETYAPFDGKGQGTGRYFEVKAFGGPIRVTRIRYTEVHQNFNTISTNVERVIPIDGAIIDANRAIYVACNRGRSVDVTNIRIDWEPVDRNRRTYGAIDLVEEDKSR